MIRVVITGSECTGKSTLATALARALGAPVSPEYARVFVEEKGAAPEARDVDTIARGQIAAEDAAIREAETADAEAADAEAADAETVVLHDTDLLSTAVYARHYYGRCPDWIEAALAQRRADLYLLADLDVPWRADGVQRDRPKEREAMQGLFRRALIERRLRYAEISGPPERRLDDAIDAIDRLRAERRSRRRR